MEHNYLELAQEPAVANLVIFQQDNNLDRKDNLDELPAEAAIYAVCGRVNGKPANARYVGETDNLREAIKKHFSASEPQPSPCFREFMQSIKIKELVYQLMPGAGKGDRLLRKELWEEQYRPNCNEELNEIH